jgi:SAM-dependent methyltransferase
MRICLHCDARHLDSLARCPVCGRAPQQLDGFLSFAPDLAWGGGGFLADAFPVLAELEARNFWFSARNRLILWAFQTYCGSAIGHYLELGCGTGFVLQAIHCHYPNALITASELFLTGLHFASARVNAARLIQMDARRIPFTEEFDVVGAFDVVEHIEEDDLVFQQAWKALKPGGWLVLTVPQHPWLWSEADSYTLHVRRYTASELKTRVRRAGFVIHRSTSFTSLLLPAMMASRWRWRPAGSFDPLAEFKISPLLNRSLELILNLELLLIQAGLDFPLGGSRLLVARKPRQPPSTPDGRSDEISP